MADPKVERAFEVDPGGRGNFKLLAKSQEEEDAFDFVKYRKVNKPTTVLESTIHMVKGALGSGVLTGPVAYMRAGLIPAVCLNIFFALFITYNLWTLGNSVQTLYRRSRTVAMSYSDAGEAAFTCHPNPKVAKYGKYFRIYIDFVICLDLFGACASYQLIIAKTLKQFVEGTVEQTVEGQDGYPHLRVYLVAIFFPIMLICLIIHLKWLAPFTAFGNLMIMICVFATVYYGIKNNIAFENVTYHTNLVGALQFTGMTVFSMSAAGVVIPLENQMKQPQYFSRVILCGMSFIFLGVFLTSFFGYIAYTDKCQAPITVNFPMTIFPIILKGMIALMVYITHALNFFVPFNLCFYYIKPYLNQNKLLFWELGLRALFVAGVSMIAITFPTIPNLLGFLGAFCISNMALLWPVVISLLVVSVRPGYGSYRWRLWRDLTILIIGLVIMCCATVVALSKLLTTAR